MVVGRSQIAGAVSVSIIDQTTDSVQIFEYRFDQVTTNTVNIDVVGYILAL